LGGGARNLKLSYSGIGDYAREELGIAASTAQKMARFARALRERPLLREAVRAGQVTVRAAEAVLPKAKGDAEAAWVDRATCGVGPRAQGGGEARRGRGERLAAGRGRARAGLPGRGPEMGPSSGPR
jgi:hypothetical protein